MTSFFKGAFGAAAKEINSLLSEGGQESVGRVVSVEDPKVFGFGVVEQVLYGQIHLVGFGRGQDAVKGNVVEKIVEYGGQSRAIAVLCGLVGDLDGSEMAGNFRLIGQHDLGAVNAQQTESPVGPAVCVCIVGVDYAPSIELDKSGVEQFPARLAKGACGDCACLQFVKELVEDQLHGLETFAKN
jgi:hypothetical protein